MPSASARWQCRLLSCPRSLPKALETVPLASLQAEVGDHFSSNFGGAQGRLIVQMLVGQKVETTA